MLNRPVISTNFEAVYHQLTHEKNGLITDMNGHSVAGAIMRLIAVSYTHLAEDMKVESDEKCLCSIGRFAQAKNFNHVPAIAKKMCEKGMKFKWFLIGYGGEEALIREQIKEQGMEDIVIIFLYMDMDYPFSLK